MQLIDNVLHLECLLVGDTQSGKSAFLSRLIENQYTDSSFPTNFIECAQKDRLNFWDCSGSGAAVSRNVIRCYYSQSDMLLILIDVKSQDPQKEIADWLAEIANGVEPEVPVRIIGTISDKISDKNELQAKNEKLQEACQHAIQEQTYFKNVSSLGCCSAKNNEWINLHWKANEPKQEIHEDLFDELSEIAFSTIPQSEEKSVIQQPHQNTMRRANLRVSKNPRSFLPFFTKQNKNKKRFSKMDLVRGIMTISFMPVPLIAGIALHYAIRRKKSQPVKQEKHACGIELVPMA